VNKDFSRKNGAIDFFSGLRKRVEQFSPESHFYWDLLKQPQAKTLAVIPVTGGLQSRGILKHYQNKSYWKP
jgi:hypothetical protein